MDNSTTMKPPLEDMELIRLLNIKNIPQPLKGNIIYEEDNLEEFFIGFSRHKVGNTSSQKIITKNLVLKNKGINLPVKRNGRETMPWEIEESLLPAKIVIILSVKEEYFVVDGKDTTNHMIIGVFDKGELINHVRRGDDMCG